MKLIIFAAFTSLLFTSCGKQPSDSLTKEDVRIIVAETLKADREEQITQKEKADELDAKLAKAAAIPAQCKINLRAIQKGVRSYSNLDNLKTGDPFAPEKLIEVFQTLPTCPLDNAPYVYMDKVPANGTPYAKCPHCDTHGHKPKDTKNW